MRLAKSALLVLFSATLLSAQWPVPKTAMDAYDFVQARRSEAEKLWMQKDPAGIDLLLKTLPYLDQPLVRDLSDGNRYLAARRLNIYTDLAEAYVLQGRTADALVYLRKAAGEPSSRGLADYFEHIKTFDVLRDNPEFRQILSGLRIYDSFWDSPALKTPYQDNISDAEKLAGLAKFWSEVKYNFGFPEKLVVLNWDQLYLDWIPRVLATKSTTAYYRELMLLCARLSDGHTNVYAPPQSDITAKPPLRTGLVEGRVMILDVRSPSLEAQGVRAGMEIAAVDGEPAHDYARREVEPYQSSSTPQDRENRTYWYGFLRGPAAKPVRLTLRGTGGAQTDVEVRRSGYTDVRNSPPFEWRMLDGNIAYVALNSFESSDTVSQWRKAFPEISKASALVLDLRINGGGDTGIGFEILRDLAAAPFLGSRQRMRKYNPTDRAQGAAVDFVELPADQVAPRPNGYTAKPVVVLSGPATFSAAEDFLVAWKDSGRGKIVGEPSGGSTGQPLSFTLPGGGSARVCTKKDMFPDGSEWVGKGIDPDILVQATVADVQAGKDTVLNRALAYLASASSH
jgi:carboxyl-terminal processing protease